MNPDYQFPFEKLRVWQEARGWIGSVYQLTATFPQREAFNLTSQLNRASVSVATNLAEGSGRVSAKDQSHFSQIAYASLMESACLEILSADRGLITTDQLTSQREIIAGLANQINALRQSQLARVNA
jgi:four helix bundle protein